MKIGWRTIFFAGLVHLLSMSQVLAADTKTQKPATEQPKPQATAASALSITGIRKEDGGKYSATLNGAIVFKELEVRKDTGGKELLFFPKTPGKGDREYSTVVLDDKSIAIQIKEAIKAGKAVGKGDPKALKVTKVKWNEFGGQSKIRGFADVTFNNAITIRGCKLIEGKDGLFVGWPSIKKGSKYDDLIFATDKGVRDMVEAAIKKEAGL